MFLYRKTENKRKILEKKHSNLADDHQWTMINGRKLLDDN